MSRHLKNCGSLKEYRDQKRQRYDQAKSASTSILSHMEEQMEGVNPSGDDDNGAENEKDEEEDNDDARDEDYRP
ncbi:MAG: hypothetical protein MJE68_05565 [Proteobacteria bacterium]|nr:hypothetical protein [Pseudomonadota bacterium]